VIEVSGVCVKFEPARWPSNHVNGKMAGTGLVRQLLPPTFKFESDSTCQTYIFSQNVFFIWRKINTFLLLRVKIYFWKFFALVFFLSLRRIPGLTLWQFSCQNFSFLSLLFLNYIFLLICSFSWNFI